MLCNRFAFIRNMLRAFSISQLEFSIAIKKRVLFSECENVSFVVFFNCIFSYFNIQIHFDSASFFHSIFRALFRLKTNKF